MSVSELLFFDSLAQSIQDATARVQVAQGQVATGKRVVVPSDDPASFAEAGRLDAQASATSNDSTLAGQVVSRLSAVDNALGQATNVISATLASATQGADGTVNATQLQALAQTVRGQLNELLQSANASYGGTFLFAGELTQAQPYGNTGVYAGDNNSNSAVFSTGTSVPVTFAGKSIFGDSTTGAIGSLNSLITALQTGNVAAVQASLPQLNAALTQIANARAALGASSRAVSDVQTTATSTVTALQKSSSDLVGVDLAKVSLDLAQDKVQQQALISIASDLAHFSLVNVLA